MDAYTVEVSAELSVIKPLTDMPNGFLNKGEAIKKCFKLDAINNVEIEAEDPNKNVHVRLYQ